MPPSKLHKYLNILRVLVLGPQKISSIAYGAKMECTSLKRSLDFLVSYGLVEERRGSGKRVVYAINERGLSVLGTFRALKCLEKLKITLPIVDEVHVASVPAKHSHKGKEE